MHAPTQGIKYSVSFCLCAHKCGAHAQARVHAHAPTRALARALARTLASTCTHARTREHSGLTLDAGA
eukprot:6198944-Pleurochrysis_carterae.AAC.4